MSSLLRTVEDGWLAGPTQQRETYEWVHTDLKHKLTLEQELAEEQQNAMEAITSLYESVEKLATTNCAGWLAGPTQQERDL